MAFLCPANRGETMTLDLWGGIILKNVIRIYLLNVHHLCESVLVCYYHWQLNLNSLGWSGVSYKCIFRNASKVLSGKNWALLA